jgi:hypothetical protein
MRAGGPVTRKKARLALAPGSRSVQWQALGPVEAVVAGQLVDLEPLGNVRCLGCC